MQDAARCRFTFLHLDADAPTGAAFASASRCVFALCVLWVKSWLLAHIQEFCRAVSLPICASLILPVSGTKSSISHEWSEFPQRTHRIWNGGLPPDRLPQSFWAELTPLSRYGMVKLHTFHKRGAHIGRSTALSRPGNFTPRRLHFC